MKRTTQTVAIVALCVGGWTALAAEKTEIFGAARAGDLGRVVDLLGASPELIDARTDGGETILHYAVGGQHLAIVEFLLAAGADASATDALGRTPLHVAAISRDPQLAEVLLALGADVNARDRDGDTPLHLAARRVQLDVARALLNGGADAEARNRSRQTPLHVLGAATRDAAQDDPAFRQQMQELAELLIGSGADEAAIDAEGTPAWPRTAPLGGDRQPSGYPTYASIVATLQARAAQYPALCRAVDLGATAGPYGRHIWAVNISDNVGVNEDEPEFAYISSMHGDEVVGSQMCLYLIDYLLSNYGTIQRVTDDVNNIDIWIVPVMNPDGYEAVTRYNYNGADLNRSFPEGSGSNPDPNTTSGKPAEVADIMNWTWAHALTLAANFHGGSLVVNYPFDNDGLGSVYSPSPDQDLFVYISEQYSMYNTPLWNSSEFYHGITNGAAWYAIDGGMQDWAYRYEGCNEVTIELGNTKTPAFSSIPTYWNDNRESMLAYMETCLIGVRGIVTNANTGAPLDATVTVVGRNHNIYTDPGVGDYHRMLLPGTYQLQYSAAGLPSESYTITVPSGPAARLDVALGRPTQVTFPNGGETVYAARPATVTWQGSPTAQFHVQYSSNYGQYGASVDDFESGSLGSVYTTGGNLPWTVTTYTAHSGTHSARAGAITHSQVSWLKRTATAGPFSFWYRVSSESNYDFFNFYIDGVQKLHRSGTVAWTSYATTLGTGSHELKWEYIKDPGVSGGQDTVWIDDISVTGDATTWTDIAALTPVGATSAAWTPTVLSSTCKVRVQSVLNGGTVLGGWDESDAVFSVAEAPALLGDLNCDGLVNNQDIDHFLQALFDAVGYVADHDGDPYSACDIANGDFTGDGLVNNQDIDGFIGALFGG